MVPVMTGSVNAVWALFTGSAEGVVDARGTLVVLGIEIDDYH